jgi:putative transposase
MQRIQAFKYEVTPNGKQTRKMRQFAGSCRRVYNDARALQEKNYKDGGKFIGYVSMAKDLTAWRNGTATPWLDTSVAARAQRP